MPILIWSGSLFLKKYLQKTIFSGSEIISYKNETYEKFVRTIDPKTFTSNRYKDWNNIIKSNNNKFIGNGVMGDRRIINQTASNLFLYNYSSGGIISVALFFIVILRAFFICLKIFYSKDAFGFGLGFLPGLYGVFGFSPGFVPGFVVGFGFVVGSALTIASYDINSGIPL
jgi:hypothetical protein